MSEEKKKVKLIICEGDSGLMDEDIKKIVNKKKEEEEEE